MAALALEPYTLEDVQETGRELGHGSYAVVVEVIYKGLRCAGKKIHHVLYVERVGDLVLRFESECRLLSQLRHPHIVQFLGVYFERGMNVPVLIMEFLPITLAQCLDRYGVLPNEISYSILHDVALGLRYLHGQAPPIIHRDLSANNVLLTSDMTAKITDLGVAKIVNLTPTQLTRMTQAPGTPCYMPPEALIPNPNYTASIDTYSYGILMIHAFSGRWPFPACEASRLNPNNPDELLPVSEAERRQVYLDDMGRDHPLMRLTLHCVSNNPSRRPTATEIHQQVSEVSVRFPASFANKVEMLQRIQAISEENRVLQAEVDQHHSETAPLQDEIEQLQLTSSVQIEGLQLEVAELKASLAQTENELCSEIRAKEAETTAKQEEHCIQISAKEQQHRRQIQAKEQEITTKEEEHCIQMSTKGEQHRRQIMAKEQEITTKEEDHHRQIMAKEQEITTKEEEHRIQMSTKEEQHRRQIMAKEQEITTKEEEHRRQIRAIAGGLRSEIRVKEAVIAAQEEEWRAMEASKNSIIASKDTIIASKDDVIASKASALARKDATISSLSHQMGRLQQNTLSKEMAKLEWQTCAPLPKETRSPQAVVIGNIVYCSYVERMHQCELSEEKWATLPSLPYWHCGLGRLSEQLVAIGGETGTNATNEVHVFDQDSQEWRKSLPPMPHARSSPAVISYSSALIVCGGRNKSSALTAVDVYKSETSQWYTTSPLPFPWHLMRSAIIGEKCYLMGGFTGASYTSATKSVLTASLPALLDAACPTGQQSQSTGQAVWIRLPDVPHLMQAPASLGNSLLALGGQGKASSDSGTVYQSVYLFSPISSSWIKIEDLPAPRFRCATVKTRTGEILVIGGKNENYQATDTLFKATLSLSF